VEIGEHQAGLIELVASADDIVEIGAGCRSIFKRHDLVFRANFGQTISKEENVVWIIVYDKYGAGRGHVRAMPPFEP
jgi:hypothetical protein